MTAPPAGALEACPFCGHVPQDLRDAFHPSGIRWREDRGQRHYIGAKDPRDGTPCWEMNCLEHEGGCGASMSGDGREEVLAKWNRRTHGPALLAALRLREWRPIAEAPKDAPVLVTFAPGDIPERQMTMPGVMVAYWDAYYAPGGNGYDGAGDGWTDAHSGEGCHLHYGNPIAFAPLPAPPTADDLARVLEESATGGEAGSG